MELLNSDHTENKNSQHIVDELFKDFISKKMSLSSKSSLSSSTTKNKAQPDTKNLSPLSEMSKLLDLEISSIQAHTYKDGPCNPQNKSVVKSKFTFADKKLDIEANNFVIQESKELFHHKSSTSNLTQSTMKDFLPISQESLSFKTGEENEWATHNPSSSDKLPDPGTPCQNRSAPSLNMSTFKKIGGPKQLGCKLSLQSLNLIQSTDKIEHKGMLWEEGEVVSSCSEEESDKAEEASCSEGEEGWSETGSVESREGVKCRSGKYKKHKHKKKKKKSIKGKVKDKSRRKRSSFSDPKKGSSSRDPGEDKDVPDETGESSHSRADNLDTVKNSHSRCQSSKLSSKAKDDPEREDKSRKIKHDSSRLPKQCKRSKSHSRSRSPKRRKRESSSKRNFNEWDARHYNNSSPKPDKERSDKDRLYFSESKHKSSHHKRSHSMDHDKALRIPIDKAKLRKIAIANALNYLKQGQGSQQDVPVVKSGGKSVEELTDFCKRISEKDRDDKVSESSEEETVMKSEDEDELHIHHPFKVKETTSSNIIMNIRNAKQLPILTPTEKQAQQAALRLAFPVSSGSHHRASESEWVPVEKTRAPPSLTTTSKPMTSKTFQDSQPKTEEANKVFPDPKETQNIDIGSIISERLQAVRKLQSNPFDVQALSSMHKAQEKASKWAASKHLPGQFMGTTGAKVMSQQEIMGDKHHQAWAKRSQFTSASPIKGGIGLLLLQKMGWKQGEGLGKNCEGFKEPLQLDFKIDRKGLTSSMDVPKPRAQAAYNPQAKDLSNKHPVSALMELCNRRRWGPPIFTVVLEDGPDHKKNFLFKVKVNNVEYQPTLPSSNKKSAKAQCAAVCLQEMGLISWDAIINY